jgi:flagellar export protein FliJ
MPPFRFRAQVALDVRRRRDEAAQRDLAAATTAANAAEADLDASIADRDDAFRRARTELAQVSAVEPLVWHRNWITGQQREVARRRDTLGRRRGDAEAARQKAIQAHMGVRVLEKLRDHAWRAHALEARRAEQKAIDWLAVLRSIARPDEHEESK